VDARRIRISSFSGGFIELSPEVKEMQLHAEEVVLQAHRNKQDASCGESGAGSVGSQCNRKSQTSDEERTALAAILQSGVNITFPDDY